MCADVCVQIGTTKGTGGDVLILEEAAYCDEGFFYETVAPILSIGSASLVAISTLTSEINFCKSPPPPPARVLDRLWHSLLVRDVSCQILCLLHSFGMPVKERFVFELLYVCQILLS